MGKVITVWGSPGSGKSMFCCILAKALTRDKRKAIIINADMNVPMLPVWLPEQIIQTNTSIGQVLSGVTAPDGCFPDRFSGGIVSLAGITG